MVNTIGKEGIVKARAVEDQLMRDTWQLADYDLLPKLRRLISNALVTSATCSTTSLGTPGRRNGNRNPGRRLAIRVLLI